MSLKTVRPAAVAGMFYPDARAVLDGTVRAYLTRAARDVDDKAAQPKALIVPHAGYVYSGPVAASAYARIAAARTTIRRVVLLGPVHRVPIRGLALPVAQAFATPLGKVEIDAAAAAEALALAQVRTSEAAHALEHALEVQLPFLQIALEEFRIVPFAVGDATAAEVAAVIDRLWGGPETLIVVSSDLSHYHSYTEACAIDRRTTSEILALASSLDHEQACGATPINGFALCARQRGLVPELLDLRNSGDTAGDKSRVVGYAAFAFTEPSSEAPKRAAEARAEVPEEAIGVSDGQLGLALISIARRSIGSRFGLDGEQPPAHAALADPGATFVTLFSRAELRGCIGSLRASRPLRDDVRENAINAAFHDPRFPPLLPAEFESVSVEVSLLSPGTSLHCATEDDLLGRLNAGIDGVTLEYGAHRATFLPQVWETLPEPRLFLAELKRKAGLASDFWSPRLNVGLYRVTKWKESDFSTVRVLQ